jgi:anti-sigma B factor antagonist
VRGAPGGDSPIPSEVRDGQLAVRVGRDDSVWTLALSGELDLANTETLAGELEKAEEGGAGVIVLDMTELEFIDSTGIALLVAAHRRLNGDGDCFRLVGSEGRAVRRVMALTGLDTSLPFVDQDRLI